MTQVREAVLAQRHRRGMVLDAPDHDTWSCGSFFTNPILGDRAWGDLVTRVHDRLGVDVDPPSWAQGGSRIKTSAAWLIERAGFARGHGLPGPASLSTKHTLAVTNRGGATATEVLTLAREVRDGVRDTFGVTLEAEPVVVGDAL